MCELQLTDGVGSYNLDTLLMKFPGDYPYSPPSVRFLTRLWHPNVYENGDLCISILHPPVDDPQSGELPSERWNPTQNVRTVLLSVISLLNEPNTFSPANVDASVMYRRWKESNGENKEYEEYVRKLVADTQVEAARDNVKVPTTIEEYVATWRAPGHGHGGGSSHHRQDVPDCDFYDDDYDDYDEDDDEAGDEDQDNGSDDSGNGES
ncbi:ubiquitin-conjugating enzyme E2 R2-like isoform X2 [Varroa destructor]|uniref:UBC core domain-containing protein n=1 Tax=Varroa destructor TaxID=109461 RepID=A0A7M7MHE7_VARDE|nr:ubiquitin-conjugating enzyme E2 R2-like isoform X2 [Varroa destructor]